MIVLGADTHKRSHTIAAVAAPTGELLGEQTVLVGERGFGALLRWARRLDDERVWALEDCRHVSGSLERFLIERGERVLRIPTHLTANARKSARQRGKSDPIDALNVARVALQEGLESFPAAQLDGPELDLRLLVDHRERLVRHRVELNSTLLWHLHDLWPELRLPGGALFSKKWTTRIGRRLARAQQTMRVRIARDELRRLRELTLAINRLEREITELVEQIAPQLLTEPGFGPLIAAKLVGEIAGAQRFATPAKLARAAGVAPIPASSGNTQRQRLDRGGNRQINAALHRVIVTRARCHPETREYMSAGAAKARAPAKRSAASSATSPAASGTCCGRPAPSRIRPSTHQSLDIEATKAAARAGRGLPLLPGGWSSVLLPCITQGSPAVQGWRDGLGLRVTARTVRRAPA
jgi:transposase